MGIASNVTVHVLTWVALFMILLEMAPPYLSAGNISFPKVSDLQWILPVRRSCNTGMLL